MTRGESDTMDDRLHKYFGKMCRICGHSFGYHSSFTFNCPKINSREGYARTYFKFGRFRQEFMNDKR